MMMSTLSGLQSIPQDQYEAAAVDGANTVQKFFHITLPNMRYPLMYTFITTVVAPRYELGWEAASVLFQRLSGDDQPPREVVLPSHLAIRESTLRTATKRLDTMFAE